MPTLADLYRFVEPIPELKNIAIIIKDLVDSGIGGHTNVDLRSSFIVIDTSAARDEDVSAFTFTGTVFIRDEMSRTRTRKKAVCGNKLWVIAGNQGNEQAADLSSSWSRPSVATAAFSYLPPRIPSTILHCGTKNLATLCLITAA